MTGNRPSCSVVIRAYNEERHLGRLLEGITQQTVTDVQIILVDSGSTDRTLDVAAAYQVQVVHISPDEFTFGRSLNRGIAQTQAERVVIASAHVYPVYPDWLERLLAPLEDKKNGLAYGKQRGAETSHFSEKQVFTHWYPEQSNLHQDQPFCNNANSAIHRSLWEKHTFDETLSGLEDIAWAKWVLEQGNTLAYVADAEVIHVHNETPQGVFNRYKREAMAFKRIFPQEQFHLGDFLRLVSSNIASDLYHAARQQVLGAHFNSIFWFRWMQFWGTYQGYRQSGPLNAKLRQTFYYPAGVDIGDQRSARKVAPIQYNEAEIKHSLKE
ncbi:MAG: glycosyltransferase family 2 protein [Anaerolineales bacterium]|nr:glycosyltransferase family 2 protein [Anaerolineales bacterium]